MRERQEREEKELQKKEQQRNENDQKRKEEEARRKLNIQENLFKEKVNFIIQIHINNL